MTVGQFFTDCTASPNNVFVHAYIGENNNWERHSNIFKKKKKKYHSKERKH